MSLRSSKISCVLLDVISLPKESVLKLSCVSLKYLSRATSFVKIRFMTKLIITQKLIFWHFNQWNLYFRNTFSVIWFSSLFRWSVPVLSKDSTDMLLLKSDQILIKFLRTAISVYIQAGQEQFPPVRYLAISGTSIMRMPSIFRLQDSLPSITFNCFHCSSASNFSIVYSIYSPFSFLIFLRQTEPIDKMIIIRLIHWDVEIPIILPLTASYRKFSSTNLIIPYVSK